jgi:hypothetical protein
LAGNPLKGDVAHRWFREKGSTWERCTIAETLENAPYIAQIAKKSML